MIKKITGHTDLKVLSAYIEVSDDDLKRAIALWLRKCVRPWRWLRHRLRHIPNLLYQNAHHSQHPIRV
ncbi:MAG: hypothetical protein V7K54_28505 [Nostoc sp.]